MNMKKLTCSTALAHDIHEQIIVHKRCLFLIGHAPGSGSIQDDDVRAAFLAPVTTALRKEDVAMSSFTPIFTVHTEDDLAMMEKERERDMKRKKRGTRGRRGVALPERDPIKTQRTLLNPLGANGLLSIKVDESTAATSQATAAATGSRRAAAIAAQANINLLAQDLPIPDRPPPSPAPAPARIGRGRGRGRGIPRVSPAFTRGREGSISAHHGTATYDSSPFGQPANHGTPTPMGPPGSAVSAKRSLREESTEVSSPAPRKRQHASRIPDSPPSPGPSAAAQQTPQAPATALQDVSKGEEMKPVILHIPNMSNGHGTGNILQQQPPPPQSGFAPGLGKSVLDGGSGGGGDSSRATSTTSRSQSPEKPQSRNGNGRVNGLGGITLSAPSKKHARSRSETASSSGGSSSSSSDDDYDATPKAKRRKSFSKTKQPKSATPLSAAQPSTANLAAPPVPPVPAAAPAQRPPRPAGLGARQPPQWLVEAKEALKVQYPLDVFDFTERVDNEWRIKCKSWYVAFAFINLLGAYSEVGNAGSPGATPVTCETMETDVDSESTKVYVPGPGQTLDNFTIHLKNRQHISQRDARLAKV